MLNPISISRILGLTALSFWLAILWTPLLTRFLYKHKLGKQIRQKGAPIFYKMHASKQGTPTMGGILIWGTVLLIIIGFFLLSLIFDGPFDMINFLTRRQTLLPLGAFIAAALIGLMDDILGIFKIGPKGGGLSMRQKIGLYALIALVGALWFYFKLDWSTIYIPFVGYFNIGFWYLPVFIFIVAASAFSVNETDGLDGLAGGITAIAFASYGLIAFSQDKHDLATFCAVICGALLAFLWFNIHPARFFMGDTGAMALGITLGIVAMLTNQFLILPLIGSVLVLESLSVIIQWTSKAWRHKKVFLSAPLHHHFEAKGWPETKITQRFWIIAGIMAVLGLVIAFSG